MREVIPELAHFLSHYEESVSRLFFETRNLVLTAAPKSNELIYDAYNAVTCAYSYSDRLKEAFCHVAAYPKHVNLGFNHGASLNDPHGILIGKGARIRHLRIANLDDLKNQNAIDLLDLAVQQGEDFAPSGNSNAQSVVKAIYDRKRDRRG